MLFEPTTDIANSMRIGATNEPNISISSAIMASAEPFYPNQAEEMKRLKIRQQLEYYFSPANLSKDTFMLSKMDAEGFIPIEIIANFNKLKNMLLDSDGNEESSPEAVKQSIIDLIANFGSELCELNEDYTKIRPKNFKRPERTTLILREVDQSVDEDEIRQLMNSFADNIVYVRRDVADTWYIRMDNEDVAKEALAFLMISSLAGREVKARLKSETLFGPSLDQSAPSFVPQMANIMPQMDMNVASSQNQNGMYPMYNFPAQMPQGQFYPAMNMMPFQSYPSPYYNMNIMPYWNQASARNSYFEPQNNDYVSAQNQNQGTRYPPREGSIGRNAAAVSAAGSKPRFARGGSAAKRGTSRYSNPGETAINQNQSRQPNKERTTFRKQFQGPEFKSHDFPSLPGAMGSTGNTPTSAMEAGAWAAAVAKQPPILDTTSMPAIVATNNISLKSSTPPPIQAPITPKPIAVSPTPKRQEAIYQEPIVNEPKTEKPVAAIINIDLDAATPRSDQKPKRGWERPELLTPKSPPAADLQVENSNGEQEEDANEIDEQEEISNVTPAYEPKLEPIAIDSQPQLTAPAAEIVKSSGWNVKKSFADIIKKSNPNRSEEEAEQVATSVSAAVEQVPNPIPKESSYRGRGGRGGRGGFTKRRGGGPSNPDIPEGQSFPGFSRGSSRRSPTTESQGPWRRETNPNGSVSN